MEMGSEFQSVTVLGKNEYFRQSLLVVILMKFAELDFLVERVVGRKMVFVGMERRLCSALWRTIRRCSFLLSASESHFREAIMAEGLLS